MPANDPETYSSLGEESFATEVLPQREAITQQATEVAMAKFEEVSE